MRQEPLIPSETMSCGTLSLIIKTSKKCFTDCLFLITSAVALRLPVQVKRKYLNVFPKKSSLGKQVKMNAFYVKYTLRVFIFLQSVSLLGNLNILTVPCFFIGLCEKEEI